MIEMLTEVLASMKNNKLRIALTGFSIGWGMFILVVLLGSSGGFRRGLYKTFYLDFDQIVSVRAGKTILPWNGKDKARMLKLTLSDVKAIEKSNFTAVKRVHPKLSRTLDVSFGKNHVNTSVTGCDEDYLSVDYRRLAGGRSINTDDLAARAKVCVINQRLSEQLFAGKSAIGELISIGGINYTVVGICKSSFKQDLSLLAYIPISTMMAIYSPDGKIDGINVVVSGLKSAAENEQFEQDLHSLLADIHECNPKDNKGISIDNQYESVLNAQNMVAGVGVFVWIIGIATLIAGIVGVSNIMLITVKERTRELGVRKAMGASNRNIITLVLLESVIITLIFGYIGMMVGVGITQLLDMALGDSFPMLQNPTVQFWPIMICNLIMVIAGLVAGYVPAKHAVNIKLVDALNG